MRDPPKGIVPLPVVYVQYLVRTYSNLDDTIFLARARSHYYPQINDQYVTIFTPFSKKHFTPQSSFPPYSELTNRKSTFYAKM